MGIIRQGILGGFRKKTGSVVGAYWRTLDVIRSLPRVSGKPATPLQKDQQAKFGLVTSWLSWIGPLIDTGYKSISKIATPMNEAVSYHLKNAITGVSPNFGIDYTKVKFSTGKLELPPDIQIATTEASRLDYSWEYSGLNEKFVDASDMATVMVYNPLKDKFVFISDAAPRSANLYNLVLPPDFSGDTVHCYISFNSVLTKRLVSNSFYMGALPVL